MQSNLTCTWFEDAASKSSHNFSGRARDTGKLKKHKAYFWPPRKRKECAPEFKTLADLVIPRNKNNKKIPWLNINYSYQRSAKQTRRCGSVYLGVVVLRVWYFEHALLQLNNCHHILPEKLNPLLYLFAEPHSLLSMSQFTTKILSFHDNVWKYAHLQCRHAWSQIAT